MKYTLFIIAFLGLTSLSSCFAQSDQKNGTITVRKSKKASISADSIQIIESIADEMPTYPGGDLVLWDYISKSVKYPQTAIDAGISGTVYVSFIVEKNGMVSNVRLIRGMPECSDCDAEALRVIKTLRNFSPAKKNGLPVRVSYNLPIKFQLK